MRWTLDDIYVAHVFQHPEPGNVDPPRTMLLSDSAADPRTPVLKNIVDHEGRSL